jgi:hypothetical protein
MKPLNRPMFKYGGPIKEGIMDGMKEKQAINTVGSPLAPTDSSGRQGYALPLMFLLGQGARMALRPLGQFAMRKMAGPNLPMIGGKRLLTMTGGKPPPIPAGVGKEQMIFNPTGLGKYFLNSPEAGAIRAVASGSGKIGGAIKKVGGSLAKSPLTVGSLGYMGFNALGPDKQPPEVKEDGTGLKRGDKSKVVATPDVSGTGGATVKTDAEKQQITEDRIQATKNRYYKLMGIDKMNKDATYDSLIDASKIIQQEGGDLKGSIKSGSLQSQLISAISKNLDKSSALKKQIDAAVLKGEIEKDIKANDPSNEVVNQLRLLQAKKLKKDIEGSSVADVIASAEISGKNLVTSNTVRSVLESKGTDVSGVIQDDKYQKWEKNNENKDEIDYLTENYGGLNDGLYVVNKKAFKVQDGSVFPIDLDSILG